MEVEEASRIVEFTNPRMHCGWHRAKPVFVVFCLDMAKQLFEEFDHSKVMAICVSPPHSTLVDNLEQAVHFFSYDGPSRARITPIFDNTYPRITT